MFYHCLKMIQNGKVVVGGGSFVDCLDGRHTDFKEPFTFDAGWVKSKNLPVFGFYRCNVQCLKLYYKETRSSQQWAATWRQWWSSRKGVWFRVSDLMWKERYDPTLVYRGDWVRGLTSGLGTLVRCWCKSKVGPIISALFTLIVW